MGTRWSTRGAPTRDRGGCKEDGRQAERAARSPELFRPLRTDYKLVPQRCPLCAATRSIPRISIFEESVMHTSGRPTDPPPGYQTQSAV